MPIIQIYFSEEELKNLFKATGDKTTSQYCRQAVLDKIKKEAKK